MLKPIGFISAKDCTGCESCKAVCGVNCIAVKQDRRGFFFPFIDTDRCVNCGMCERVCPVLNPNKTEHFKNRFYALRAADDTILFNSSSGGVFSVLANYILEQGGYVCGAAFAENYEVKHIVIDDSSKLYRLQGSKYVQSRTSDALTELRRKSKSGAYVMFVGTPCQVAGARRALFNINREKLLLVEVVCHGVPSPGVYKRYLQNLEIEQNSKLKSINFRDKSNGWRAYRFRACFEDGSEISHDGHNDPYVSGFIDNLYLRNCCTSCKFKGFSSGADLTIGDFWGVESLENAQYADDKGVSLLSVNTDQGNQIFNATYRNFSDIVETDIQHISAKNQCLIMPTTYNPRTIRFYKYLKANSVADAVAKAKRITLFDKIAVSLKYRIGRIRYAKS